MTSQTAAGATITAKYAGFCRLCRTEFRPGELISFRGGHYGHAECPQQITRTVEAEHPETVRATYTIRPATIGTRIYGAHGVRCIECGSDTCSGECEMYA